MNLRNAIGAFSLLLFSTLFTSCQKDHDLVSSYVIKNKLTKVETNVEVEVAQANKVHNNAVSGSKDNEELTEGSN